MVYMLLAAVISQVVMDLMVVKAEFVHKNFNLTESLVGDSSSSSSSPSSSSSTSSSEPVKSLRVGDATLEMEGAEVRCYCNLPRCVTLGYMCKSLLGACFTNNTPAPTHAYSGTHKLHHRWAPMNGCVELLPRERQAECVKKAGVRPLQGALGITSAPTTPVPPQLDPALSCCRYDMCNYGDLDVYIQVESDGHADRKRQDSELETLWFRAATIAVPIAGGFILIVLVLLASKMLAKESKRQRMAQQVLGEHYLKAALYSSGSSAALTHTAMCCHPPLTKDAHVNEINLRNSCEEKHPIYRHPGGHACNIEEIKPLNTVCQDDQWDQREAESPPLS